MTVWLDSAGLTGGMWVLGVTLLPVDDTCVVGHMRAHALIVRRFIAIRLAPSTDLAAG
jgi:hypothetical protein